MSRLLVNADDFGLHPDINRGVLECVDRGVVRSLSVVATGRTIDWLVVGRLRQSGGARVGMHLTLVGEPWLTRATAVPDRWALVRELVRRGPQMAEAIHAEAVAQLGRFLDHGIRPDHLDSHQHVHVLPVVWPVCVRLAEQYGIPRIRLPLAPSWRLARRTPSGVLLQQLAKRRARTLPDLLPCIGLAQSGRNTAIRLAHELQVARGRDVELVAHPGDTTPELANLYRWGYDWSGEREALLSAEFWRAVEENGFTLA
jgi:predicted glycoside hydrolase/deacetylase ChbG (UPF0249 family)